MMKMKNFVAVALMGSVVFAASAAFAATTIGSYEDLQRISSITLVELNNDGGRQALLTQDLLLSDGQFGYCGNNNLYGPGTVFYANSLVYIYIKRPPASAPTPAPTTPANPASDDRKVDALIVSSFEELQAISSTPLQDNGDGGRGATLIRPIKVAHGQKVLCGSETPLEEGTIVEAGSFIYMWLAPEGFGLTPANTLDELRKKGNLDAEEDGVWYTYSPDELVKFSSADIRAFDMNDFGNEVEDGILRKDGAYKLFLKKEFKDFTPKSDEDLKVLAHPKTKVETGPVWTPDTGTIRNFWVVLASEWIVKENTDVLFNSQVNRVAGELIPAGGKMLVSVSPIADPDNTRGGNSGNSGSGGGGGCDAAGLGLPALALVGLALRKRR